jgi:tRNA threonylcarbamoyladenosine biosynthesis protein TsaE
MEFITQSPEETKEAGRKLAASLIEGEKKMFIGGLVGELGAGKTTFTQGFAEGLGIIDRIISPTFILLKRYKLKDDMGFDTFYHADLYRLEGSVASEVRNLGLPEIMSTKGSIVLVEWAEKAKELFPPHTYWIEFQNLGEGRRKISIKY